MSVKERIEEQIGSHDVLLYMKGTPDFPQCGFSGQTVAALNAIGKPYAFVNIFVFADVDWLHGAGCRRCGRWRLRP